MEGSFILIIWKITVTNTMGRRKNFVGRLKTNNLNINNSRSFRKKEKKSASFKCSYCGCQVIFLE